MSANTDFVRKWVADWNRGEIDALVAAAPADMEWTVAREHPDATTHKGVDAVADYLREWLQMMPDLRIDIEEIVEEGDRVLSILRLSGTGMGSGATTQVTTATITTFRDGVAVRTEEFLDTEEARAMLAGA